MQQERRLIVEVIVRDDAEGDRFIDNIMQLPLYDCMVYVRRIHDDEWSTPTLGDDAASRVPCVLLDGTPVPERFGRSYAAVIAEAVTAPRETGFHRDVSRGEVVGPN